MASLLNWFTSLTGANRQTTDREKERRETERLRQAQQSAIQARQAGQITGKQAYGRTLGAAPAPAPTFNNTVRPSSATALAGQSIIDTVTNNKVAPVALGIRRSAIGTGEGVSGLYDLATPGKGTNRLGKSLVDAGARTDKVVDQRGYNKLGYKAAQAGTDLATFAVSGAPATRAVSTAGTVASRLPGAARVARGVDTLADANKAGRIAVQAGRYLARPDIASNIITDTALNAGLRSNRGKDVSPGSLAVDAGTSVGMGVALGLAGKAVKPIADRLPQTVYRGGGGPANFVTKNKKLAQEFATDTGTKVSKYAMRNKDILDPRTAEGRAAVEAIVGPDKARQLLNKTSSRRFDPSDETLARRIAEKAGFKGVAFDESGLELRAPKTLRPNPISYGINDKSALMALPSLRTNQVGAIGRDVRPDLPGSTPNQPKLPGRRPSQSLTPETQVQNKLLPPTDNNMRPDALNRVMAMNPMSPAGQNRVLSQNVAAPETPTPQVRVAEPVRTPATATESIAVNQNTPLANDTLKVTQRSSERNIPVSKLTRDGDTVTATNVNPNIKKGEKRFAVNDAGELVEDRKGAYRVFTDNDGRVQQVRIGNEVYTSKDFGDLSDVNDYGSTLATMRRNVERAFGKDTGDKLSRFLIDHQQAQATKMIERQLNLRQDIQKVADDLGINFGVGGRKAREVSADIQRFGEGDLKKADIVQKYGQEYADKIVNADKWFRAQYDSLLDEMNATLTKYGYDPVPKRQNYYTHFQDETLWNKFGLKMQEIRNLASPTMQDSMPEAARGKISNKLAGESEFTQPNKRFNPFALRREGADFKPDAFQAFERYLSPTLNNIYMTPSITRARVISKAVAQDADIMGKDANKIIIQVKEWANNLAGKSNRFDRPMVDSKGGQMYLKAAQWAQKKAGQNTIVGNLSTAVMQPIVLSQTAGKFGYKNTILAAMQEMSTAHAKNAPIRQSSFMKRRYAEFLPVTAGKMDRARDIANTPLEVVEQTAARITWNAAHNDAISKGLRGAEAIRQADIQTEKTLSGRAIGERPELFRSKGAGPLTMYQLEVNNFWQQFGKEMTKAQAAKTMVAAYGLNLILQEVTGRQVGFNPIDAAIDSYQELQKEDKDPLAKAKTIGQRWAGEFVDNVPFVAPIANAAIGDRSLRSLLGQDSNVGRFGVSSPISALTSTTNVGGVPIPQNLVLPFGGGQAKKTYEGLQAYLNRGIDDKESKRLVDIPQNPTNLLKAGLFGKGSIPEVGAYYQNIGKKKVDQIPVPNQIDSKAGRMAKDSQTVERGGKEVDISTLPLGERYQEQIKQLGETGNSESIKSTVKEIDGELNTIYGKYGLPNPGTDTRIAEVYADYHKKLGSIGEIEKRSSERKLLRDIYKSTLDAKTSELFGISSDNDIRLAVQDGLVNQDTMNKAIELDNFLVANGLQSSPTIGNKLRRELGYASISSGSGRGRGGRGAAPKIAKTADDLPTAKPKGVSLRKRPAPRGGNQKKVSLKTYKLSKPRVG